LRNARWVMYEHCRTERRLLRNLARDNRRYRIRRAIYWLRWWWDDPCVKVFAWAAVAVAIFLFGCHWIDTHATPEAWLAGTLAGGRP